VRNEAIQNFGPIIHSISLKSSRKSTLFQKVTEICNTFYNLDLLRIENKIDLYDSFSIDDDSEKIKEMWAFNMPCVLQI
jgi:hypothetical protein